MYPTGEGFYDSLHAGGQQQLMRQQWDDQTGGLTRQGADRRLTEGGATWVSNNSSGRRQMSCWSPRGDTLYCKEIPMSTKTAEGEKYGPLTVKIDAIGQGSRSASKLHIELTNEADPCFLFTLGVGESEFHALKSEQRLLVDFQAFPAKFIELLEQCLTAAQSESTRQRLSGIFVVAYPGGDGSLHRGSAEGPASSRCLSSPSPPMAHFHGSPLEGRLSLVEANQFKELTHLSLLLQQGDDNAVKKHLTKKLTRTKASVEMLQDSVENLQSANNKAFAEVEKLKNSIHAADLERAAERERTANDNRDEVSSLKKDWEARVETWKVRAEAAEARNTHLSEKLSATEAKKVEAEKARDAAAEHMAATRVELSEALRSKSAMEKTSDLTNESAKQLRRNLENGEAELASVKAKLEQLAAQSDEAQAGRKMMVSHSSDLEKKLTEAAKEIHRGNEIISKQRAEVRSLKAKAKVAVELESKLEALTKDSVSHESMREELNVAKFELQETQKTLKKKQLVIDNLSKQLTERELQSILQKFPAASSGPLGSSASAGGFLRSFSPTTAPLAAGGMTNLWLPFGDGGAKRTAGLASSVGPSGRGFAVPSSMMTAMPFSTRAFGSTVGQPPSHLLSSAALPTSSSFAPSSLSEPPTTLTPSRAPPLDNKFPSFLDDHVSSNSQTAPVASPWSSSGPPRPTTAAVTTSGSALSYCAPFGTSANFSRMSSGRGGGFRLLPLHRKVRPRRAARYGRLMTMTSCLLQNL